jgi:stress response protein SCP2
MRRGFKAKLTDALDPNQPFSVEVSISGNAEYDFSCFGLNGDEKLSDDRYFVFYNNERSPRNEISLSQTSGNAVFTVNLTTLPAQIQRLCFTVNIDGNGVMREIAACCASIKQNGAVAFRLNMTGSDFQNQKAIIAVEIYKKEQWRVSAVAAGFNGGLPDLLRRYGGEVAADEAPPMEPASYQSSPPSEQTSASHNSVPPLRPSEPPKPRIRDVDGSEFTISNNDWV